MYLIEGKGIIGMGTIGECGIPHWRQSPAMTFQFHQVGISASADKKNVHIPDSYLEISADNIRCTAKIFAVKGLSSNEVDNE